MSTEREHQEQLKAVKVYYNKAQKFYYLFWHGNSLGLHYGFWNENTKTRHEAILEENKVLADLAKIKNGELVLDAGCGVAGSGIWLAKHRGAKVTELNIVNKQLLQGQNNVGKSSLRDKVNFTAGDYHRLPFADGSFDVFWSLESIEHADNLEKFTSEAYRVLKEGGRAVIAGTFKGSISPSDEQRSQLDVGFRAAGAFNDFRTAEDVSKLMFESGFKQVSIHNANGLTQTSANQMSSMCQLGLPFAKLGHKLGFVSQVMVDNTEWGTYQDKLFYEKVTSYDVIVGMK